MPTIKIPGSEAVRLMETHGLSESEMARWLNVDRETVHRWVGGDEIRGSAVAAVMFLLNHGYGAAETAKRLSKLRRQP